MLLYSHATLHRGTDQHAANRIATDVTIHCDVNNTDGNGDTNIVQHLFN